MLPVVDLHQDLLPHVEARHVYGDVWQTSLPQLADSCVRLIVASTWTGDRVGSTLTPEALDANEQYMRGYRDVAGNAPGWHVVREVPDVDRALSGTTRGLVIHVEGLPRLQGHIEEVLERWFGLGCRS